MRIERLDHPVLSVANIELTFRFYTRAFGIEHVSFDERHALGIAVQKINLHDAGHAFEPKAERPTPGAGDICLVTKEGPLARIGALEPIRSIYDRDPDRNLIEISTYDIGEPRS